MAVEFRLFLEYARSLTFDDRPDYGYLQRLFRELFFRKGFTYDCAYDWDDVLRGEEDSVCNVRGNMSKNADIIRNLECDDEDDQS